MAKMIALITIHAMYCGPEIRRPGTRIPRMRTAIAFGAKLNQVIECSSRNAKATTLIAIIHGEAIRCRKRAYASPPLLIARIWTKSNATVHATATLLNSRRMNFTYADLPSHQYVEIGGRYQRG